MKKVLVTGGCGFLGSHVCELFRKENWEVISVDNLTKYELSKTGFDVEAAREYNLNFLNKIEVKNYKNDICDIEALKRICKNVDYIVHTAAQPAMTLSISDPVYDFNNNIKGTLNILEVAKELEIPVATCSTAHVYGNLFNKNLTESETRYEYNNVSIDEDFPILQGSLTPLHVSKGAADLYTQAYSNSYNMAAAVFRLTGIYGPRQFGGEDHGWVANFVIRNILNKRISIFGSGKQLRDILYVTDAARAFYNFYYHQRPGVYNLSGGEECMTSLVECIELINKVCPEETKVNFEEARKGDLNYFVSHSTNARKYLDWKPSVLPIEGVENLANWVRENIEIFKG